MFSRFRVVGRSMEPSFREGDYVIIQNLTSPKTGDVVVVNYTGKRMIKRVTKLENKKYITRGDNQLDGKIFAVSRKEVVGKVFFHARKK